MILFDIYSLSQLPLVKELAVRFRSRSHSIAISYNGSNLEIYSEIQRFAKSIDSESFIFEVMAEEVELPSQSKPNSIREKLASILFPLNKKNSSPINPYETALRKQLRVASNILTKIQAKALIVCEDGPGGNAALIKAANDQNLPVLVCPFGMGSYQDFDNFVEEKFQDGTLHILSSKSTSQLEKIAPQWIKESNYGKVIMFPEDFILAREKLGMSLKQPWVVHGGYAQKIAVESDDMLSHYRREKIDEDKLARVGTVYCDVLYDELSSSLNTKAAFENKKKITPHKTRLLISMPPSYHETRPNTSEFSTYRELCEAIIALEQSDPNINMTFSLHPATLPEDVELIKSLNVNISEDWLVTLIPKHDIFLTFYSSTIRWAIATAKPVLNYDIYKLNITDFDTAKLVYHSDKIEDIRKRLIELCDDNMYESFVKEASTDSEASGIVDGQNFDRIYNLLLSMQKK